MNDKEMLLNAIFFPIPPLEEKKKNDYLIDVGDKIKIGARFFLKNQNFPTILFFHGNAELSQEYNDIANYYNSFDCNFIVADYRGYGFSAGTPTKDNLHADSNKIFIYVKEYLIQNNYNNKIIIMGRSLGSASACEIISNHEECIFGCIIESGFATEAPFMKILDLNPSDIDYNEEEDGFGNLKKLSSYSKPYLLYMLIMMILFQLMKQK